MPRTITQRFEIAGEAIREEVVGAMGGVDHTWFNLKPYEDSGLTVASWLATVASIVRRLNEKLGEDVISVPDSVAKDYGSKILRDFQVYLALAIPA